MILDDFHKANAKDKFLNELENFGRIVLIVDDIFGLSFKNENLINEYQQFQIEEFSPSLRNELLEKWISIRESDSVGLNPNHLY